MLELFGLMTTVEKFTSQNKPIDLESSNNSDIYPISWVIVTFIIAFGTAYLAYSCNDKETPATRAMVTIFAFFFSGFYLIYYFIIYILLNKKCNGKDISELIKRFK